MLGITQIYLILAKVSMQHQNLFIFDIETIFDTDAVPNLTDFDDPDTVARRQKIERYHLDISSD
jgi:hypothetical protein